MDRRWAVQSIADACVHDESRATGRNNAAALRLRFRLRNAATAERDQPPAVACSAPYATGHEPTGHDVRAAAVDPSEPRAQRDRHSANATAAGGELSHDDADVILAPIIRCGQPTERTASAAATRERDADGQSRHA